jgi:hypothetical protein
MVKTPEAKFNDAEVVNLCVKRKALSESEIDADLLHVSALLAAAPLPLFAVDLL